MNMAKCVGDFECQSVGGDAIANLTDSEIGAMLSCAAWRRARSMRNWRRDQRLG